MIYDLQGKTVALDQEISSREINRNFFVSVSQDGERPQNVESRNRLLLGVRTGMVSNAIRSKRGKEGTQKKKKKRNRYYGVNLRDA